MRGEGLGVRGKDKGSRAGNFSNLINGYFISYKMVVKW